ncbi:MAG: TIGR03086 family metal-binding protein [Actinomycetota bacterium]
MDPFDGLRRALDDTGRIVRDVDPEKLGSPTPCTEWDARAVLNHLLGQLWMLVSRLTGEPSPNAGAPGGLPAHDLVESNPSVSFDETADLLLSAARAPGALDENAFLVTIITGDVIVHGWDIAKATGIEPAFDDDVVEHLLSSLGERLTDENRSPAFAPAVAIPDNARIIDRLVAFLGRDPAWSPPH